MQYEIGLIDKKADDTLYVLEADYKLNREYPCSVEVSPKGRLLYRTGRVAVMSRRIATEVYHLRKDRRILIVNPVVFNKLILDNHYNI